MSVLPAAAFNIVSSVSIILVNKQIASVCGFDFIITMLFLNFLTTASLLELLARLHWFEKKHLPWRDRWLVAGMALLTVLLNNCSNEANSVGFYQITKLLIIPTVMGLERIQGKTQVYSRGVKLSIIVTAVGVAVATVSDFEINARGSVLAVMSIIATAQYQIWQGSKQHEHGVTATQITYSVAWPQSLAGFVSSLLADMAVPKLKMIVLMRPASLLDHQLSGQGDMLWIALCNILAVCTNISVYGLIGKTSPVTYQIIGQLKTVLVVAFGYIFFDVRVPLTWLLVRFAGVAVAVVGIFSYAMCKNAENAKSTSEKKTKAS
eukprot:TRINITY_DN27202_c0_g1_i1.p1 TRINITY_DN27202_c0_g1~~TRINITY_DN27202_c0_g1_i1.p1  ORF type:complete len:334 (+),score=45.86 TRINITY_DN27202_c0_g1_i1:41-1003(+)